MVGLQSGVTHLHVLESAKSMAKCLHNPPHLPTPPHPSPNLSRVEPNALSAAELKALQATLGSSAEKYIILKIRNACVSVGAPASCFSLNAQLSYANCFSFLFARRQLRVWYVDCHNELTGKKVLRALGRKFCKKFPDPGMLVKQWGHMWDF